MEDKENKSLLIHFIESHDIRRKFNLNASSKSFEEKIVPEVLLEKNIILIFHILIL